jgi:hypothetical protein
MTAGSSFLKDNCTVSVYEEPPENGAKKIEYSVAEKDFVKALPKAKKKAKTKTKASQDSEEYLIIGFDTEYKTSNVHVKKDQIIAGQAKYRVLSYQFHAKMPNGAEWQGICCTENDERMSFTQFLAFAIGKGIKEGHVKQVPLKIYLAGHFTRADIPAFSDFKAQKNYLSSVRNTFLSIDQSIKINFFKNSDEIAELDLIIRDTMLLTPQASKSLKAIGDLVGVPKKQLDPDIKKHKELIEKMDEVRRDHWEKYREYALEDATICVRYLEKIIELYEKVTEKKKVPVTLTSIGVDLLLKSWKDDMKLDPLEILGKERIPDKKFKNGYFKKFTKEVAKEELYSTTAFITETYHGGRSEQFWFGPGKKDNWIDIDLAGAYPTAMALIGQPRWSDVKRDVRKIKEFTPTTLGFALVEFEFPKGTRYPTLPVRTANGLIFPLKGTSYCAAPEIYLAKKLKCKIKIKTGIIFPSDPNVKIFGKFIKDCTEERKKAGNKTMEGLFWKEISNSTYGKTAQGLREKRVFDMRSERTVALPESRITNAAFASYITSFVRAVLGEILNKIPKEYTVFSCTTDGFITNLPESRIGDVINGELAKLYSEARNYLVGNKNIVEIKHRIKQPLGWRTRGQATLKPSIKPNGESEEIILAKSGIFTKPESETDEQQNKEIVDLFFNRDPNSIIRVESLTGVRDIVVHGADLVEKEIEKRLSMEYDWKRQPSFIGTSNEYNHVYFNTKPWAFAEYFTDIRDRWDNFNGKNNKHCIKTKEDYRKFQDYIELNVKTSGKSVSNEETDIKRLRMELCRAWHEKKAGLVSKKKLSADEVAKIFVRAGLECKRYDVENGRGRGDEVGNMFVGNSCPRTKRNIRILEKLKKTHFPNLQIEDFLIKENKDYRLTIKAKSAPKEQQVQ